MIPIKGLLRGGGFINFGSVLGFQGLGRTWRRKVCRAMTYWALFMLFWLLLLCTFEVQVGLQGLGAQDSVLGFRI